MAAQPARLAAVSGAARPDACGQSLDRYIPVALASPGRLRCAAGGRAAVTSLAPRPRIFLPDEDSHGLVDQRG